MINKENAIELARQHAISSSNYWTDNEINVTKKNISGDPCWCVHVIDRYDELGLPVFDPFWSKYFISMVTGICIGFHELRTYILYDNEGNSIDYYFMSKSERMKAGIKDY